MKTAKDFYQERDLRTKEYTSGEIDLETRIHIQTDIDIIYSQVGQTLLLALVNQLSRVHKQISISVNPEIKIPLLTNSLFSVKDFASELFTIMRKIDPFGGYTYLETPPEDAICLGIGKTAVTTPGAIYLGANGSIGYVSSSPKALDLDNLGSTRGAAVAACLGACAAFQKIAYGSFQERTFSIWNLQEGDGAEIGPLDLEPIRIGKALMLGAGAIGSGVTYWSYILGEESEWHVVEKDILKLHNTNRGLTFFPEDTDFFNQEAKSKASITRRFITKITTHEKWYHEVDLSSEKFDVILCLANEYSVRQVINFLPASLYLQATTGKNWLAQLHRHIPLRDDCIFCRTGEIEAASFGCSSAQVNEKKESDAALPFLSALSSLALVVGLQRMDLLTSGGKNDWRIDLKSSYKIVSSGVRKCKDNCGVADYWNKTVESSLEARADLNKKVASNL